MNIITDFTSVTNSSCLIRLMVASVENIQLTNLMKLISSTSKFLSSFRCQVEAPRGQDFTRRGPETNIIVVRVDTLRHPARNLPCLIQCYLNGRSIRFPRACASLQAKIFGDNRRVDDPPAIRECVGLRPNKGSLSIPLRRGDVHRGKHHRLERFSRPVV